MTEAEWNACTDPTQMLKFLRGEASDRKLRLFACAGLRRVLHLATAPARRGAVEIAERLADGIVTEELCRQVTAKPDWPYNSAIAKVACDSPSHEGANRTAAAVLFPSSQTAAETVAWNVPKLVDADSGPTEQAACASIVCDIFGNPFRPVTIDPHHLTAPVTALAQAIYDDRAFDRLPILADALEDAGCTDPEILAHCRGAGLHFRGCWVVDLLTGRK